MRVISALIAMTVLFISGIWVQESISEIDPESLMGMWHFDQGKGQGYLVFGFFGNIFHIC